MTLISIALSALFVGLAVLHIYWAAGGKWGASAAVPSEANGAIAFTPGVAACLIVSAGFFAIAYLCAARAGLFTAPWPNNYTRVGLLIVAALFLARTIGDRKYMGITRRIRETEFARKDRRFYTPLCGTVCGLLTLLALAGR